MSCNIPFNYAPYKVGEDKLVANDILFHNITVMSIIAELLYLRNFLLPIIPAVPVEHWLVGYVTG